MLHLNYIWLEIHVSVRSIISYDFRIDIKSESVNLRTKPFTFQLNSVISFSWHPYWASTLPFEYIWVTLLFTYNLLPMILALWPHVFFTFGVLVKSLPDLSILLRWLCTNALVRSSMGGSGCIHVRLHTYYISVVVFVKFDYDWSWFTCPVATQPECSINYHSRSI